MAAAAMRSPVTSTLCCSAAQSTLGTFLPPISHLHFALPLRGQPICARSDAANKVLSLTATYASWKSTRASAEQAWSSSGAKKRVKRAKQSQGSRATLQNLDTNPKPPSLQASRSRADVSDESEENSEAGTRGLDSDRQTSAACAGPSSDRLSQEEWLGAAPASSKGGDWVKDPKGGVVKSEVTGWLKSAECVTPAQNASGKAGQPKAEGWIKPASKNGAVNGWHANGHVNGYANGHANGYANVSANGSANGHAYVNGNSDESPIGSESRFSRVNGSNGKANGANGHSHDKHAVSWDIQMDPLSYQEPVQEVDVLGWSERSNAGWLRASKDWASISERAPKTTKSKRSSKSSTLRALERVVERPEGGDIGGILPSSEEPCSSTQSPQIGPSYGRQQSKQQRVPKPLVAARDFVGSGTASVREDKRGRQEGQKVAKLGKKLAAGPRKVAKGKGGVVMQVGRQVVRVRQDGSRQVDMLSSEEIAAMAVQAALNTADIAAMRAVPWNEHRDYLRQKVDQQKARWRVDQRQLEKKQAESYGQDAAEISSSESLAIGQFLAEIGQYDRLSLAEEAECSRKIKEHNRLLSGREELAAQLGDEPTDELWAQAVGLDGISSLLQKLAWGYSAKQRMVEGNLRLVVAVAKEFRGRGLPFLDLCQMGVKGLNTAVERYDVDRGTRFGTVAVWWIRQSIAKACKEYGRMVRLPSSAWHALSLITRVQKAVNADKGRPATTEELAAGTGLSQERIRSVLAALRPIYSLEGSKEVTRIIGDSSNVETFAMNTADKRVPEPIQELANEQADEVVQRILTFLEANEAQILRMRYGLVGDSEHSLFEVARSLKRSVVWVRQMEDRAVEKLRGPLRKYVNELLPIPA